MVNAESIFEIIQRYFTDSAVVVLAIVALLFLLKDVEKKYKVYVVLLVGIVLLVFNDFSYSIVEKLGESETFYRFLWIFPVTVLCGYLITELWYGLEKRGQKLACILILTIGLMTNYKLNIGSWFDLPENVYQISDEQIKVAQILKRYKTKWRLKFWDDGTLSYGLREYDGSVMLEIDSSLYMDKIINNELIGETGSNIQAILCNEQIDVVGVKKENILTQTLFKSAGCRQIGETESSYIYSFKWRDMEERWKNLISYYNEAIYDINEEYIIIDDLESTYKILYLTDMNIDLEKDRYVNINGISAAEQFKAWIQLANLRGVDAVLLGGNTLYSYSEQNVKFLKEQLELLEMPYLYLVGDRDLVSEDGQRITAENDLYGLFEVTDNKSQILDLGEFKICTVTEENYSEINEIAALDEAVILMTHTPFLYEDDTEQLMHYQQNGDIDAMQLEGDMKEALCDGSAIVEILAGRAEMFDKSLLNDNVVQYVGNASYRGGGTLFVIRN